MISGHNTPDKTVGASPVKQSAGNRVLHICTLCAFAISQPLYDIFSRQAEFFVARQALSWEIIFFILLVSVLAPLPFLLASAFSVALGERLSSLVHQALLVALVALLCLIALNQNTALNGITVVVLALGIGVLFQFFYHRTMVIRQFLSVLSLSVLVFPVLFILSPNVRTLVMPVEKTQDAAGAARAKEAGREAIRPPLVVVIFDELALTALLDSADQIDAHLYPNLAALAATSSWYRNATTVVPVTNYAVPAILTGRYPNVEALPVAAYYSQTLFSLLRESHEPHVFESVTRLCPPDQCVVVSGASAEQRIKSLILDVALVYGHVVTPSAYAHRLPALGNKWGGFVDARIERGFSEKYKAYEKQIQQAIRENIHGDRQLVFEKFLAEIQPWEEGKPPLHFLHILFPHTPWMYYPSGRMYTDQYADRVPGMDVGHTHWGDNQRLADQGYQRYLMQIELLDKMVGRLIAKLKSTGLYDRSMLVFTADHGASFIAGDNYRKLSESNLRDVLPVPLLIKKPGQTVGLVDDSNVQIIDIFPTIAETMAMPLIEAVDGSPVGSQAISMREGKRAYDFYSRWENKFLDLPSSIPGRQLALEKKIELFGTGINHDLYALGSNKDLLGTAPTNYRMQPMAAKLHIEQAPFFQDIDLSQPIVPGFLSGYLEGGEPMAITSLAIALNGVIHASAEVYLDGSGKRVFTAVLPEQALQSGENRLSAYGVSRNDFEVILHVPTNQRSVRYQLGTDKARSVIEGSNGAIIPLIHNAVIGFVDKVIVSDRSIEFSGWALDSKAPDSVTQVLLFVNGKNVYSAFHNGLYRPDMEKHYQQPNAGYRFFIPASLMPSAEDVVQVIAVSASGVATELVFHESVKWR